MSSSAPIEPKPRGAVQGLAFAVTEQVAPFVATQLVSKFGQPPSGEQLTAWIRDNNKLLSATPGAPDQVDGIVDADFERAASLEGKALAVLQGVAIVSAILVAIEIVVWDKLSTMQQVLFAVSNVYAFASFFQAITVTRPKIAYIYAQSDIQEQAQSGGHLYAKSFAIEAAARQLGYVRANEGPRRHLANAVIASLRSLRNATVLAVLVLVPNAVVLGGAVLVGGIQLLQRLAGLIRW
jgi:hypothetical protein